MKEKEEDCCNDEENSFFNIPAFIGIGLFVVGIIGNFNYWIEFGIFFTAYLLLAWDILLKTLENVKKGRLFDENFLMSVASIGAFFINAFPEAVAIMLFNKIGESIQNAAVAKSKKSISALANIRQDYANVITDRGGVQKFSVEEVCVGAKIIVKPGEKIPLDSVIVEGNSTLDMSVLTGESIPKYVGTGSQALSGSINIDGLITLCVEKTQKESTIAKILDLVQNSLAKKTATEKFITKFAKIYTPIVMSIAFFMATILPIFIPNAVWSEWIRRALVFLVVSCPCALIVSIPLGFFGGIACASRRGILVKGSNFLDALNDVKTIIFDKTGTLTEGKFSVEEVVCVSESSKEELLKYAAFAESFSNHPIAKSIVSHYNKEIEFGKISDYKEVAGKGVSISFEKKKIVVGSFAFLKSLEIECSDIPKGCAVFFIAIDRRFAGYIVVTDKLKSDSVDTIKRLKKLKVFTAVLTGDSKQNAENVIEKLQPDLSFTDLLPQDKVEIALKVKNERSGFGKIAFVGDGINDAPVIAVSDIGFAMGAAGSDAAVETADIVLMSDEPSKIVTALFIAKKTRKIVVQNIVSILAIKGVILVLGAFGIATIWMAVVGDVGVTVAAVLNSLRALYYKEKSSRG
ncbi:MAG: cadmium-translocating P-type ATPase [Chitinispirillales bacterium]|jgi:Cd2+/Zn2+-exporting ATPase|nr:cadmium-translocating P-type ATPase [Chitinispirillales bacterium]